MRSILKFGLLTMLVIGLTGCFGAGKEETEYNKTAQQWYDAIQRSVARGELEKADKQFLSLRSEHMDSSLLPTTMLILAQAHMAEEEYLLANYYLDEYLKRAGGAGAEYARFLKLKASFLGIHDIDKDQKLVADTLAQCKSFYASHRSSRYAPLVQTMIVRLEMSQYLLNASIAHLYERIGKEKGAEIYRKKNERYQFKPEDIDEASTGLISKLNPFN